MVDSVARCTDLLESLLQIARMSDSQVRIVTATIKCCDTNLINIDDVFCHYGNQSLKVLKSLELIEIFAYKINLYSWGEGIRISKQIICLPLKIFFSRFNFIVACVFEF